MAAQPTDIHIPASALEEGAKAIDERVSQPGQCSYHDMARAAFLAIVKAWPGMERYTFPETGAGDDYIPALDEIILPMTEKTDAE